MPFVSIMMNCRNCAAYLREALDSVYEQTFKDYEIIFWDNLSTDNSAEIALNYGEPLRYFRSDKSLPLGAARNAAISKAKGELIAFLDCDDIWLPDKLARQVELIQSNERIGLVYSDCLLIDETGIQKTDEPYRVRMVNGEAFDRLFLGNFIPMPTVMIKSQALSEIGLFKPEFEILEEYDLWLRLADKYQISSINKPLAKYRRHGKNISKDIPLAYDEGFRIIDYWVDKRPELKKWGQSKIKQSKAILHIHLLKYYLSTGQKAKSIRQMTNLAILLPFSFIAICKIIKKI